MFDRKRLLAISGTTVAIAAAAALIIPTLTASAATSGHNTAQTPEATTTTTTPTKLSSMLTTTQLTSIALSEAAATGDPSPTLVQQAGPVPRSVATQAMGSGDTVHSDALSYVMAVQGTFTVHVAAPPLGPMGVPNTNTQMRTYSVMTIVVDANTGGVTDFGLAFSMPDMSAAGPVTTDVEH